MIKSQDLQLDKGITVRVLEAGAVPEPDTFLSTIELAKYSSFKVEKRRLEWLGGRWAAKTLLRDTFAAGTGLKDIEITYDKSGRPEWKGRTLSISHSWPFCAAACSERAHFIGMDIEKAEPRAKAWYTDYFHTDELAEHDQSAATALWTRKEALLKALGLGLKADLLDIRLGKKIEFSGEAGLSYEALGRPQFGIYTTKYGQDHYISVAWDEQI